MILVTGSKGFIAKHFIRAIKEPVLAVDDEIVGNVKSLPWKDIKTVYHMGAVSSTTETDIALLYRNNIQCSMEIFHECCIRYIPIVYASSASVYGNLTNREIEPLNAYALSKATVDIVAKEYIEKGMDIVGMRFFNVYGDGEDHKRNQASPIHQFTKQAKETGIIKVFERSETFYRDFVWVGDVVRCIFAPKSVGICDVGTSNPISFMKVAELIADKYNAKILTIPFPEKLEGKYQTNTCAKKHFDLNFISVEDYLKHHSS